MTNTLLAGCMLLVMSSHVISVARADEIIYDDATIGNNSIIPMVAVLNVIQRCSFDNAAFESSIQPSARLIVSDSTVSPGSVLKLMYTGSIFATVWRNIRFQINARIIFAGIPGSGPAVTISNCSFDVRTPISGDIIAIDMRSVFAIPQRFGIVIDRSTIKITSNTRPELGVGLVAALATAIEFSPTQRVGTNQMTVEHNIVVFNTTGVAYGIHCMGVYAPVFTLDLRNNIFYHVANGGGDVTVVLIDFPITTRPGASSSNFTFISRLAASSNEVRRIRTFFHVTGYMVFISVLQNLHSHFAETRSNFSVSFLQADVSFDIRLNIFEATFEAWNPLSAYGNPTIVFGIPFIDSTSTVLRNDFHASRYVKAPIQFTGATNMWANSELYLQENYFTSNQLTDNLAPMVSFASAETRATDLGTVYVCSNTWPALFVAATTTLTAPPTTTISSGVVTRTAVASVDSITLLVESADRPKNVSLSGGLCPFFVTTRQLVENGDLSPVDFASVFVTALAFTLLCYF